jgi:hypothetical protein
VDVTEIAPHGPAPGIHRRLLGEVAEIGAILERTEDVEGCRLVGEQDVMDAARLTAPESIRVADVVLANGAPVDRHRNRHAVDEARHDLGRQDSLVSGGRDAGCLRLMEKDRFGHKLLDDPAARSRRGLTAVGREVTSARPSSDIGQPRLEP